MGERTETMGLILLIIVLLFLALGLALGLISAFGGPKIQQRLDAARKRTQE